MNTTSTLPGGGKFWSVQNSGSVHVTSLGAADSTTFVASSSKDHNAIHETTVHTVHTTQGELNIADPFTTHISHGEPTPAELAGAAAASAFETFAPNTPLTTSSTTDTLFAPKISSAEVYSTASSPTGQFENFVSSAQDTTKYESTNQSKIFGGQDTLASSKKHPQEDPYKSNKTRQEIFFLS
jgi:hypothetical protein